MRTFYYIFLLLFLTLTTCKKHNDSKEIPDSYKIQGTVVENATYDKLYLYYEHLDGTIIKDSAVIDNHSFSFQGKVTAPTKALIKLHEYGKKLPFILGNEIIDITINPNQWDASFILNSSLNKEWNLLEEKSKKYFREIDYLFPALQKARLENDFTALSQIQGKIDSIQKLNKDFLINQIKTHKNMAINHLILNDLYQNYPEDSLVFILLSRSLPKETQMCIQF
jgi:hypothetical protein